MNESLASKRDKKYYDKRHRKTETQTEILMRMYHASKGEPSRSVIDKISNQLQLSEL